MKLKFCESSIKTLKKNWLPKLHLNSKGKLQVNKLQYAAFVHEIFFKQLLIMFICLGEESYSVFILHYILHYIKNL